MTTVFSHLTLLLMTASFVICLHHSTATSNKHERSEDDPLSQSLDPVVRSASPWPIRNTPAVPRSSPEENGWKNPFRIRLFPLLIRLRREGSDNDVSECFHLLNLQTAAASHSSDKNLIGLLPEKEIPFSTLNNELFLNRLCVLGKSRKDMVDELDTGSNQDSVDRSFTSRHKRLMPSNKNILQRWANNQISTRTNTIWLEPYFVLATALDGAQAELNIGLDANNLQKKSKVGILPASIGKNRRHNDLIAPLTSDLIQAWPDEDSANLENQDAEVEYDRGIGTKVRDVKESSTDELRERQADEEYMGQLVVSLGGSMERKRGVSIEDSFVPEGKTVSGVSRPMLDPTLFMMGIGRK